MLIMREPLSKALEEEMETQIRHYYEKTEAGGDSPPLNFWWEAYESMASNGLLRVITAREDKQIVGLAFYAVMPSLHHKEHIVATCSGIYANLGGRSKGIGRAIIDYACKEFTKEGVNEIVHASRACYDVVPLFEKLEGFTLREKIYSKKLT